MKAATESSVKSYPNNSLDDGDGPTAVRTQIKNLQAFLKERQLQRAKYYGQPVYSVSSSSINIDGNSETTDPKQSGGVINNSKHELKFGTRVKENAPSASSFVKDERSIHLAWHIPKTNNCSLFKNYPEFVGRSQILQDGCMSTTAINLPIEEMLGNKYITMYCEPSCATMPSSSSVQVSSSQTCRGIKKKDVIDSSDFSCTSDFSGIMNCLFQLMLQAIYQIFLVMLQMVPFVEIFPVIYDFIVNSLIDLQNTPDKKELVRKSGIYFFQISLIIAACFFILFVVLLPVISLGHSVLRKLFFFV